MSILRGGRPPSQAIDQRHEGMVAHVERVLQDQRVNHTRPEILFETGRSIKPDNLQLAGNAPRFYGLRRAMVPDSFDAKMPSRSG